MLSLYFRIFHFFSSWKAIKSIEFNAHTSYIEGKGKYTFLSPQIRFLSIFFL